MDIRLIFDDLSKQFNVIDDVVYGDVNDISEFLGKYGNVTVKMGHKDFEMQSDENLPIESELIRRDAKLNAMAIDLNNEKFVDPLGGLDDIQNKQISAANPNAFSDDPLRMLRMIGFASRFGFTIEPGTMEMIQKNAESIKRIPAERIIEEFKKIIEKGNPRIGVELLVSTGLFKQIFGNEIKQSQIDRRDFESAKSMADFLFLMMHDVVQNPSQFYLSKFSTEDALRDKNYKLIKALEMAFANTNNNPVATRSVAHNMYVMSPVSLESSILPSEIKTAAQDLLSGRYPKTVNELAVNGGDLMQLGLKGKEVGDMQKSLLLKVYGDKVHNDKNSLLAIAKGEQPDSLDEAKAKEFDYKYEGEPFYFDPATVSDKKWQTITTYLTKMGWEARPYTDWKDYFMNMGAVTMPGDKYDADWSNDASKIIAIKRALTPKEKPSDEQAIITKAKRIFGTTTNYKMAGYLLPDGSMLDFSGYRQGYRYATSRTIDHREINPSGADMVEFMAMGNIRMQSNGFELTQEPTRQQLKTLWGFLNQINGEIKIDFTEKNTQNVMHSVSYPQGTRPNRILNDVVNYYRNSVKPVAPVIAEEEIVDNNVIYSAVVLDDESRSKLLKIVQPTIPDGWEVIAHHMTIKMGAINPENRSDLNSEVTLDVIDYAIDDMAFAVGVGGYPSNNKKPHITIAINRLEGAKPVMSNNLTNWKPLGFPLKLKGTVTEIKRTSSINESKTSHVDDIEYGCLMLYLDEPRWNEVTSVINDDDVYDVEGYGIEKEPHVTILYGFHDGVKSDEVFEMFKENHQVSPITIKTNGISVFNTDEFDVVKLDVISDELVELNKVMKALPNTQTFPKYHPHITIAYVKKGTGDKYITQFKKNRALTGNELLYSYKNHKGKKGGDILSLETNSINESVEKGSKYSDAKNSLMRSKSISREMKENIAKYLTGGSTYHEGGRVHGLRKPKEFTDKTPKADGVSLGADKNGFYCYTHRAASKRYDSPEKIPVSAIEFIESTG